MGEKWFLQLKGKMDSQDSSSLWRLIFQVLAWIEIKGHSCHWVNYSMAEWFGGHADWLYDGKFSSHFFLCLYPTISIFQTIGEKMPMGTAVVQQSCGKAQGKATEVWWLFFACWQWFLIYIGCCVSKTFLFRTDWTTNNRSLCACFLPVLLFFQVCVTLQALGMIFLGVIQCFARKTSYEHAVSFVKHPSSSLIEAQLHQLASELDRILG